MIINGVETDTLTDEQLRELALGTATLPEGVINIQGDTVLSPVINGKFQPRDDQGRFVAPDPAADPAADPIADPQDDPQDDDPQDAPQEFVRVIDLGDGSGVQVFRGATAEEVADKLVEAQRNASRKIRQDNQELKALQARLAEYESKKETAPLTEDQKFLLSQKFSSDPVAAVSEVLELQGLSPKELREAVQQKRAQDQINTNIAVFGQWLKEHPDFVDTASNGTKVGNYLRTFHRGVATMAALDDAYRTLKADGLLQETAPTPTPTPAPAPASIIRRTSSLSSRRSSPPPPPRVETEEDLRNMPLEKLREKANGGRAYGGW